MILCKFLRGVFSEPFDEWAALLNCVTGWDLVGDELRETARRVVLERRVFNLEHGWTPDEDWLPPRFLTEPVAMADGREVRLDASTLRSMIDAYYVERGLDTEGMPLPHTLAGLTMRPAHLPAVGARR
jgi:aldehyde:ferredoxin oxidoreductase